MGTVFKTIRIACKGSGTLKLHELTVLQGDLKSLSRANYEKLRKEIETRGFSAPFFVWKSKDKKNYILDGTQRYGTLEKMQKDGYSIPDLPIVEVTAKNQAEARRKLLAFASQYGKVDPEGLFEYMKVSEIDILELKESFDLQGVPLESFEVKYFTSEAKDDIVPIEKPKKTVSKPGDLWILGNHRLICGDSTDPKNYERLAKSVKESPFLMVTDPPYGVNYDPEWRDGIDGKMGTTRSKGKVKNDHIVDWSSAFKLFTGDVAYVWHASFFISNVQNQIESCNFKIRSLIIWRKQSIVISRGDYHWQHEPCWYAVRKGKGAEYVGGRAQSTVWEIKNASIGGDGQDMRTGHGTQKPIECMARPIRNHGKPGNVIYDPFMGSGTTIIACEQLDRTAIGMEIDPGYCDVIIDRWERFSNGKARKA